MQLSVSAENIPGISWTQWKTVIEVVEQAGFPSLFCSDHFSMNGSQKSASLEVFTALTYLADHSQRIKFGTLVSPFSFRDPVMMLRQALAINDLSGGRMILGVGSGWKMDEHSMFGYNLGELKTRADRFEEGVKVITQLMHSDKPVTFEGQFFQLRDAQLPPSKYPLPLLIGGSGKKRTLPLAARYANLWGSEWQPANEIQDRNTLLDELLRKEGRQPKDVKRTAVRLIVCWRNEAERERMADAWRQLAPMIPALPTDELIPFLQKNVLAICGTPDVVIEELRALEAAGLDELMWQYLMMDSLEQLTIIAEAVLPHFNKA